MGYGRCVAAAIMAALWACASGQDARAGTTGERERRCLALALYWEAKTEGREGMLAVASVVLNRLRHPEFPDTVCGVVEDGGEMPPCQFSWWCDGKSDRPTEAEGWLLAQEVAADVLRRAPPDRTRGALFFHTADMAEPWRRPRTRTVRIGSHVFYR